MRRTAYEKLSRSIARALVAHVVMAVQGRDSDAWVYRDGDTYGALVASVRASGTWAGVYINAHASPRSGVTVILEIDIPGVGTRTIATGAVSVSHDSVWQELQDTEACMLNEIRRAQRNGL